MIVFSASFNLDAWYYYKPCSIFVPVDRENRQPNRVWFDSTLDKTAWSQFAIQKLPCDNLKFMMYPHSQPAFSQESDLITYPQNWIILNIKVRDWRQVFPFSFSSSSFSSVFLCSLSAAMSAMPTFSSLVCNSLKHRSRSSNLSDINLAAFVISFCKNAIKYWSS